MLLERRLPVHHVAENGAETRLELNCASAWWTDMSADAFADPLWIGKIRKRSPMLVMHGLLRRWQTFGALYGVWGEQYQVHALDHRGHGESTKGLSSYLVADYVNDGVALVQAQGWKNLVIYGHSLGAMVAMGIAARVPEAVQCLLLEDPPLYTMGAKIRESAWHRYFTQVYETLPLEGDIAEATWRMGELVVDDPITGKRGKLAELRDHASLRFTVGGLMRIDREVLRPVVDGTWMEGFDWKEEVRSIQCPTLMLQGEAALGGMLSDEDAAYCRETIRDCAVVPLKGVGHVMHWPRTQDVIYQTMQFLGSL